MKKIFCILSFLAIISPAFAEGETPTPVHTTGDAVDEDPGATTANGPTAAASPKYSTIADTAVDATSAASAKYVKGAYNATIKAVNTVANLKQDKLTSTGNSANVVYDANTSGPVVTGVTADNGTVTVARGEVTIPVGAASGNSVTGHAQIWIQ